MDPEGSTGTEKEGDYSIYLKLLKTDQGQVNF